MKARLNSLKYREKRYMLMIWKKTTFGTKPTRIEKDKDTKIRDMEDDLNQKNDKITKMEGDISKKYGDILDLERETDDLKGEFAYLQMDSQG